MSATRFSTCSRCTPDLGYVIVDESEIHFAGVFDQMARSANELAVLLDELAGDERRPCGSFDGF